jgi:molybdate transport system permease protein
LTRPWPGPEKTLGLSNSYILLAHPNAVLPPGHTGRTVLSFARALGEYGATSMIAGFTPGKTATISTTVYQLWRTDNDALAFNGTGQHSHLSPWCS